MFSSFSCFLSVVSKSAANLDVIGFSFVFCLVLMLFIRSAVDIIFSDYPSSWGLFYLLLTGLWLVFLGVDPTLPNPRSYRSPCCHTCPPGWTMSIIMIWSFFPVNKKCLVFGPENLDQFEYWSPKAAGHPRSKLFFPLYTLLEPGPFHGPKVPRGYFTG